MSITHSHVRHCIVLVAVVGGASVLAALPPERAAPPTFTDADLEPFFPDAREALVGERPMGNAALGATADATGDAAVDVEFHWSEIVDAEALDTEVKRIASRLEPPLASPAAFKASGHNACRAEFAMIAVLFGVIDQYDGDVRWQRDAAALRDAFARASVNCKTASDQSYGEATRRRDDLLELIRGGRLGDGAPPPLEKWSTLAERKLLMQRMQRGLQDGVNPHLVDARAFTRAAVDVGQEASMLALLAELIHREDYEYWDDDTFLEYSRELGAAAELSRAAADGDYESARAAAGRASQACATCHDGYRA